MAIVVEDGTGLSNSDSYLSVADCDTYLSTRGLDSVWTTKTTAEKEAALLKATTYLDSTYQWIGQIYDVDQALDWPRIDAWDDENRDYNNKVPQPLKDATAELAVTAILGSLSPAKTRSDYVQREKVGSLEVEYSPGAPAGAGTSALSYPLVDGLLRNISNGSGNGYQVPLRRV